MIVTNILKYCTQRQVIGTRTWRSCSQLTGIKEWLKSFPGGSVDLQQDNQSGVAVVTLNHEDMKNAMSGKMMADLADVTDTLQTWKEGKGVIVHGAGDTFCSGGNLSFMGDISTPENGQKMCLFMQDTMWRFFNLPLISVALINGRALGGGAEVAVACDFRLVTPKSVLGFVQSRMGVSPGWGGGTRLVQLLGRTDALELLTTGNMLPHEEILSFGLANGIVSEENALEQAQQWLGKRIHSSKEVLGAAKGLVVSAMNNSTEEAIECERTFFTSVWGGPAHIEAMNKRMKHRK